MGGGLVEADCDCVEAFGEIFQMYDEIKFKGEELGITLIGSDKFSEDTVMRYHFVAYNDEDYDATAGYVLNFLKKRLNSYRKVGKKIGYQKVEDFITDYMESLQLFFQSLNTLIKRADKSYKDFDFSSAVELYKKADQKQPDNIYLKGRIGNCYKFLGNITESEQWYAIVAQAEGSDNIFKFHYAQSLMANGKYNEALKVYNNYFESIGKPEKKISEFQNKLFKKDEKYEIKVEDFNSEFSDFSPLKIRDDLYFVSNRQNDMFAQRKDVWSQRPFTQIFHVDVSDTTKSKKGAETLLKVAKSCRDFIDKFRKVKIPSELSNLLNTKKKREQTKLLNGLRMNPDILMAFLLMAGDLGYKLSQYESEHQTKAIDSTKMPMAYRKKEDGTIEKFGKTELTDGQLKQALEQRSVKVAKILEKDNEWHCFFLTFNSIGGKENWKNGQPHFHYISNLFGIEKKDVIEQIKSKNYKLGNLPHIALDDYGKQPEEKACT